MNDGSITGSGSNQVMYLNKKRFPSLKNNQAVVVRAQKFTNMMMIAEKALKLDP